MKTRNRAKKIVENYLGVYDKRTLTENEKGILVSVENMVVDLLEKNNSRPVEKLVSKKFADAVINCIPTNWIDPLLTGKTAVLKGYDYKPNDIENLLRALKKRVEETVSKFSY